MRHGTGGEFPPGSGKRWMGIQFNNTDVLVNVYAGKHNKRAIRLYGGRHKRLLPGLNSVVDILTRVLDEGSYKGKPVQARWSLQKKLEVASKQIETFNKEVSEREEMNGLRELGIVEKSIRKRKRNSIGRSISRSLSQHPSKKRVLEYNNTGPQSGMFINDRYSSDEDTVSVDNHLFTDVVIDLPPRVDSKTLDVHEFNSSNFPLPPLSPKPEPDEGFVSRATSAGSIFDLYESDVALCSRSPSMQPIQMERKQSIGEDGVGGCVSINVYEPPKYSPLSNDTDVKLEDNWNFLADDEDPNKWAREFDDRLQPDSFGFPFNDYVPAKVEREIDFLSYDGIKSEDGDCIEKEKLEEFRLKMVEDRKNDHISYLEKLGDPLQRNNPEFLKYCQEMGSMFHKHCSENLKEVNFSKINVLDVVYSYEPSGQKRTNVQFVEIDKSDFEFFWQNYVKKVLDSEDEEALNFNERGLNFDPNAAYYLNWKRLLDPLNNDGFLFLRRVDKQLDWCWNFWIPLEDKHIKEWEIAQDMFNFTN